MRRSWTLFGPKSNIEKITNKHHVSEVLWDQMSRKKGGWVQELFPTHPTYQNPIFMNPIPLLCNVSWFIVFSLLAYLFHFFGPIHSETNRVFFHTRDLLPESTLLLEHFLDHFWAIYVTLSPGVLHFLARKSRAVSRFQGLDFGRVFEQFLGPILGTKSPLETGNSEGQKLTTQKDSKKHQKSIKNGCLKCALLRCGSGGCNNMVV